MNKSSDERFDWVDTHFLDAKKIALFYVDLLERVVDGEKISRTSQVKAFAREKLSLNLSTNVADGLFYAGSNRVIPGPIYRMGLEPRIGAWKALPRNVALDYLNGMRTRISELDSLPTVPSEYYRSGSGKFLTPMTQELLAGREIDSITTSDFLEKGLLYSRKDLGELFGIGVEGLSTGVFKPRNHQSIWLFVTRKKTPDRTQYHDNLRGSILEWDGQEKGLTDKMIINHARDGIEILLFYREKRNQFPNFGFIFEGEFEYLHHIKGKPSKFHLRRVLIPDELNEADVEIESEAQEFIEGRKRFVYKTEYERDPKIRNATIRIHGFRCMVCDFDFEEFYGVLGRGYIQAHHLIPISASDGPRSVDPKTEIAVVCSNCHSMIHRDRKFAIPLDVLKGIVEKQRINHQCNNTSGTENKL